MPDAATTNNKRTRSQTTLDQFRFNPAASPLKQARSALKNAPTTAERPQPPNPSQPTPLPPPASGADDNVQDGTMDDHHLKRPSSPGKDAALLHQPDLKRPRHAIFPPPKPSTLAHPPSTSPSSPDRRAKSVPPSPSPVPLLDLNNVPPSPRRSPTKFRIASVPPEDRRDPSPDPDYTDDPAMILPPTANSFAFVFEHATPAPATSNRTARLAPVVTPMSPLTPLPLTLDDSVRTDSALDLDATPVPRSPKLPPLLTAQTPASESTPRASTSHTQLPATTLPPQQPKLAHPPLQSFIPRQSGVKSRMRPKGKAAAVVASTIIAPQDIAPPAKKLKNPRDTEKNHLLGTVPSTVRRTHSQKPVSRPGRAKSEAPERKPAVYGKPPSQVHPKPSGSQTLQSHPTPRARTPHAQPLPSQAPRAKTPSRPISSAPSQPLRTMSRATSKPPPLPQRPLVKTPPVAQLPPGPEPILQDLPRKLTPEPPLESSQPVAEQQESQLPPSSPHPASETDHRQSRSLSLIPTPESEVELEPELEAVEIVQVPQRSVSEQPTVEASPVEHLNSLEDPLSPLTTDSEGDQDPQTEPPQTSDLPQSADLSSPKPDPTPPISSTLQLTSSLSHLTEVLNKLNTAPPSRPNTSMGFHRSISGTSDGDESFSSDTSVGTTARPDAGGTRVAAPPGAFTSAGKPVERPRPGSSMSTSTAPTTSSKPTSKVGKGRAAIPATPNPTGGQKQLKQTTLMLPPPIPSTRTTRLRSQAVAAAAATATASAAGSSTPAPAKTPAKETGKEKMGTQTKLFPALAAATAAFGIGSAPRGSSARTARSSFNRPVFAFARLGANAVGPTAIATSAGTGRGGSNGVGARGPFAFGAGRGTGRVTQRVSKASSLPMVIGSPVKGSGTREDAMDIHKSTGGGDVGVMGDVFAEEPEGSNGEQEGEPTTKDKIDSWLRNASKDVLRDLGHGSDEDEEGEGKSVGDVSLTNSDAGPSDSHTSGGLSAEEKERLAKEREARRNASRRASMASHLLSQSLSALPDLSTTAATLGVGKDVKGKARAVSSTYPNGSAASGDAGRDKEKGWKDEDQKEEEKQPPAPRAHNTRLATGALSTPPNTYKERGLRGEGSAEGGKGKGKAKDNGEGELGGSGSPAVGALAVLRDCRIFVDVRTDEGDDAGGLFVDMLRGMGAKIANRVGSRCTHVVFKNGLMSTISRYKSMDPKPHVVGIAWVVECVEQRIKVDESRFAVNLQHMNIAGVNKRRKSMLPKHYSPVANKIAVSPALSDLSRGGQTLPSMGLGANGPSRFAAGGRSAAEGSRWAANSSLMDVDDGENDMELQSTPAVNGGSGGAAAEDDELARLPPLERARRRKSMLMGLKP